jgi:putative zinc finger/helix-turn-helix YgiT family protein
MEKCYVCGGKVKEIKDTPYKYDECGLNVVLCGITQYECSACGEKCASIPDIKGLHRLIGTIICQKRKAILRPQEIIFLRKSLQYKAKELSRILGVDPATVSRWENGKQDISDTHDRLLRSLYLSQNPKESCKIIELFKELPAKRKKIEQPREITLNPQEWLARSNEDSCLQYA